MAEKVKFHGQVVAVSGTAATIDDDNSVTSAGITDTGGISTDELIVRGSGEGVRLFNDSGDEVRLSIEDMDGTNDTIVLTRI